MATRQSDDTQAYYGDGNRWQKVAPSNCNVTPEKLQISHEFYIP